MFDVAVIGAGIAGMATAARLRAAGLSTVVFEAHVQPGGCTGFFQRRGFSFDVGATTLVDFSDHGVGGELLCAIGMPLMPGSQLPGYVAWLPDTKVTLYRDQHAWADERLRKLGDSAAHRRFWKLSDDLAAVFWDVSRQGGKLPIQTLRDLVVAAKLLRFRNLPTARFLRWTMGDALRHFGLRQEKSLVGLLSMLLEDTLHSTVDTAPLINAALGITIRGAGLTRPMGGMRGFWRQFVEYYRQMGGQLRLGCNVQRVSGRLGRYRLATRRGQFQARQVVSAVPAQLAATIARDVLGHALDHYLRRDAKTLGGAVVLYLGVPDEEVSNQELTHHQLLHDYDSPLGNGNNMFISVSSPGDHDSAPPGHRAVMVSTHCELEEWKHILPDDYQKRKHEIGQRLLSLARRVYPSLGERASVSEVATPRTFQRFTQRPDGCVGGVRQSLKNTNQDAIPHNIGPPGFHLVGDSTWPGLGTVACVLGSRIVARQVLRECQRIPARAHEHEQYSLRSTSILSSSFSALLILNFCQGS